MISSNKTKGFTLVELLIVIVVIAILATISIVAYSNATNKAHDDRRSSNARNLLDAMSAYETEHSKWPTLSDLTTYEVIKLVPDMVDSSKVNATVSAGKHTYKLQYCKGSGFTTNNLEATGARIEFLREVDPNKGVNVITAGRCS